MNPLQERGEPPWGQNNSHAGVLKKKEMLSFSSCEEMNIFNNYGSLEEGRGEG